MSRLMYPALYHFYHRGMRQGHGPAAARMLHRLHGFAPASIQDVLSGGEPHTVASGGVHQSGDDRERLSVFC